WREKKMANVDYFELLHILEFKKAERVKDCAEVLEYKVSYETGEKTLYRVWFCKSRLCPMCNWRRAMKHGDRKSTRLNSSHVSISYAVFCLKKKIMHINLIVVLK